MPEYIEREAVMPEVDSAVELYPSEYDAISNKIDKIPAADVVEVVRCKDCKHYASDREKGGFCKRSASPSMWRNDEAPLRPDDFCSYGERKSKPTLPETTRQTVLDSFMKGSDD